MRPLSAIMVSIALSVNLLAPVALASSHPARHAHVQTGLFDNPYGIALDRVGNIFVTDLLDDRVVKLSPSGKKIVAWGTYGSTGPSALDNPQGVAIGPDGRVYVVDSGNRRVQVFSATGRFLKTCCSGATAVGFDSRHNLYVGLTKPGRVERIAASGRVTASWRTVKLDVKTGPNFIAGDARGGIYVSFGDINVIEKFDPSGKSTELKGPIGVSIAGIAVDARGAVYGACDFPASIVKFSADGKILSSWASARGQIANKVFGGLFGLALDAHGEIYLVDADNHRVLKLSASGTVLAVFK